MFVRKVNDKKRGVTRIQLVESQRVNGKVKQKIIRHVATAKSPEEVEQFYKLAVVLLEKEKAKQNGSSPLVDSEGCLEEHTQSPVSNISLDLNTLHEEKRVVEGPSDVFGTLFDNVGFNEIIPGTSAEVLKKVVIERASEPASKLKSTENMQRKYQDTLNISKVYRMMDKLDHFNEEVLKKAYSATSNLFSNEIDLVCFDVTTLAFESTTTDDLRKFGFSKDHKFHNVQVTLALATTREGVPIGYKLFPGNTAEATTLIKCIETWKKSLPIKDVTFVADGAMFSTANLHAIDKAGYRFLVAAPIRKLSKSVQDKIFSETKTESGQTEEGEEFWKTQVDHTITGKVKSENGEKSLVNIPGRLIASYSSKRGAKDKKDREKIIDKLEKQLEIQSQTGEKRLVSNSGYKKYAKFEGKSVVSIDENKVKKEERLDGMHGLFTNTNLSGSEAYSRYKHLLSIEESFRISKSNLEMRPIYHYTPKRIRAHISICFLALCLVRYLQVMLFKSQVKMSVKRIQEAVNSVQASLLNNGFNEKLRVPSKMSDDAKAIYSTLKIRRKTGVSVVEHS